MKKTLLSICLVALTGCITGCTSTNISKVVEQLKDDQASVTLRVTSIYGNLTFMRVGGRTNQSLSISPDGTITVNPAKTP